MKSITGKDLPNPGQQVVITGIETMNLPESWDEIKTNNFKQTIIGKTVTVCTSGTSGNMLTLKTIPKTYGESETYMTINVSEVAFKEKVYIAGPISGYTNKNREAFEAAEKELKENGYFPVNPHKLDHDTAEEMELHNELSISNNPNCKKEDLPYSEEEIHAAYMKTDLAELLTCDAIIFLEGWEKSKGAMIEFNTAKAANIKTLQGC